MSGALVAAAAGLLVLTQVTVTDGLTEILIGSVVISLGLGPVFGLTTEMIVGSAPPEKAGAASGISETAAELGAALGIAVLGSVGVAIYRSQLSPEALTGRAGRGGRRRARHPGRCRRRGDRAARRRGRRRWWTTRGRRSSQDCRSPR